jgi:hypothetical protein
MAQMRVRLFTQWLPWIGLDDVVSAFYWALMNEQVAGPVNVTSPNPVTNREFTKTLGRVLHRPTFAAVPEALLNLAGDMGREMLLTSQRVMPTRLTREAFPFRDTQLEPMLTRVLGRGD